MRKAFVSLVIVVFGFEHAAIAEDIYPRKPSQAVKARPKFDWSGVYFGGHIGYAAGVSQWSGIPLAAGQSSVSGSFNVSDGLHPFKGTGSYFAGLQAGYNFVSQSRVLLGWEADLTFSNTIAGAQVFSTTSIGQASYGETVLTSGTLRSRFGYAFPNWLVYGTSGLAWTYDRLTRAQLVGFPIGGSATPGTVETALRWRLGWTIGGGFEVPLAPKWTAKLEYLYTDFGQSTVTFPAAAQRVESDLAVHNVRLGLNYQLGDTINSDILAKGPQAVELDNFSLHAQTTFLSQYAFPFRAPYHGPNSLDANSGRETWDITFYAGVRLWQGAELWINPEIDQGFGLGGTLGVAGFPSGEAYKVGAAYPYTRVHRAFIRQTIDLGGETEKVQSDINKFSGVQTADRLVFTIGKVSVVDIFDTNKYAHDPRGDFMNWSIADTGTFDYAADAWGYTYGAAVEWYRGPWALRAGLFDLSVVPNSTELDPRFQQFQWVGEIERRYQLWGQPGKVAVTGFLSRGRMGRFDDAVQLAQPAGEPADITAVRRYGSRGGLSLNLEQQIISDLGIFARGGFANGNLESYEFTDIDRTIAAGLSLAGKRWGRPDDTFGIASVNNEASGARRTFLKAGGLGILVGDGTLPNPGTEQIIETFYSFPLAGWRVTLDYQFINNPAYNRDRGPVSVIGTRVRGQF